MKKLLIISFSLLILVSSVAAQESYEHIPSENGRTTIIRQNDIGEWMVFSNPSENCEFMKVIDGNSVVRKITLPSDFIAISDFEVDCGVVYFCGTLTNEVPCMGYFLSGSAFPNVTVRYLSFPNLRSLKKLEVITYNDGTRVLMTGRGTQSDVIVEATNPVFGGAWNVNIIVPYIPGSSLPYSCDDIAITDSNVVVTTNTKLFYLNNDDTTSVRPSSDTISGIWYFNKPFSFYGSLTVTPVKFMRIKPDSESPIRYNIRKCEKDAFVVVGINEWGKPYVCGYNKYTHIGTVKLNINAIRIKAFDYSPDSKTLELAVDVFYNQPAYDSRLYTLNPGMLQVPTPAHGHRFPSHLIKSMVYQGVTNPLHFICVGNQVDNTSNLYLYRYFFNTPYNCSLFDSAVTTALKQERKPVTAAVNYTSSECVTSKVTPVKDDVIRVLDCESVQ